MEEMRENAGRPKDDDALRRAVHHADASVRLGLVSEAVLRVGQTLIHKLSKGGYPTFIEENGYEALARVAEARNEAEKNAWMRQKERLSGETARKYVCAARGCGIQAAGRAALKACAGRCPPGVKPHYCGKECQKRVSLYVLKKYDVSLT